MSDEIAFNTLYVPLPADLWAQAAYLTMRPTVVRDQASAMLVRVAQMAAQLPQGAGAEPQSFEDLPAERQAWVVGLVRCVLTRFATSSR